MATIIQLARQLGIATFVCLFLVGVAEGSIGTSYVDAWSVNQPYVSGEPLGDPDGQGMSTITPSRVNTRTLTVHYALEAFPHETGLLKIPIARTDASYTSLLGYGWGEPLPHLGKSADSIYFIVVGVGNNAEWFKQSDYSSRRGAVNAKLAYDGGTSTYTYTWNSKDGKVERYVFNTDGELTKHIDALGVATDPVYTGPWLATLTRKLDSDNWSKLTFAYVMSQPPGPIDGRINHITLARTTNASAGTPTWTDVRRVNFEYYASTSSGKGQVNDLKRVEIQKPTWTTTQLTYFRYHTATDLENGTLDRRLKMVLEPAWYTRIVNDDNSLGVTGPGDLDTVTDPNLLDWDTGTSGKQSYVSYYWTYFDSTYPYTEFDKIVARSKALAGGGTFDCTEETVVSVNGSDPADMKYLYNAWKYKAVVEVIDASSNDLFRTTGWMNHFGQAMLVVTEGPDDASLNRRRSAFYYYDDADGNDPALIEWVAERSAIDLPSTLSSLDSRLALLAANSSGNPGTTFDKIFDGAGIIRTFDYGNSTSATTTSLNDVKGYLKATALAKGETDISSPTKLMDISYYSNADNDTGSYPRVFVMGKTIAYADDSSQIEANSLVTTYAYTWQDDGGGPPENLQFIEQQTVNAPAEEGLSPTTLVALNRFDAYGRLEWVNDSVGLITHYEYSPATGWLSKVIDDVDTAAVGDEPGGWSTEFYGGLHLETDYSYDSIGRGTEILGPRHRIDDPDSPQTAMAARTATWMVFKENDADELDERWTATGWQDQAGPTWESVVGAITVEKLSKLDRAMQTIVVTQDAWDDNSSGSADPNSKLDEYDTIDTTTDNADYRNWQVVSINYDGLVESTLSYHTIPNSGSGSLGTNYYKTEYEYEELGRISRIGDLVPTGGGGSVARNRWYFYKVHHPSGTSDYYAETLAYPAVYYESMSWKLGGAIRVTWLDEDNLTVRRSLATATVSGATPTGNETLTELTRMAYLYNQGSEWRNRLSYKRAYHDLNGLSWDSAGTLNDDYYQAKVLAYDNLDRRLRVEDSLGTITARVYPYNAVDREVKSVTYVGTNATGATRKDPSAGGGGNNMKAHSECVCEDELAENGPAPLGGDSTAVPYVGERRTVKPLDTLAGTSADFTEIEFHPYGTGISPETYSSIVFKYRGTWEIERPAGLGASVLKFVDGVIEDRLVWSIAAGSPEITGYEKFYGPADRLVAYAKTRGGVLGGSDPRSGFYGPITSETTYAYDKAGRMYKETLPAGAVRKIEYDDFGRVMSEIICSDLGDDEADGTFAGDVGDDIVIQEVVYEFDQLGRPSKKITYRRDDNDTTTEGLLSDHTSIAQISYVYFWHDYDDRPSGMIDYGVLTTGAPMYLIASMPLPNTSDNYIVTKYEYDDAGRRNKVTDNLGKVNKTIYDDLSRKLYLIENYSDFVYTSGPSYSGVGGGSNNDQDRVTRLAYNSQSQVTERALMLSNSVGDEQETTYTYGEDTTTSPIARNDLLLKITYPDSQGTDDWVTFTYWADGSVETRTDQRKVKITYAYDNIGRLTSEEADLTAANETVDNYVLRLEYTYDGFGRPKMFTSEDGSDNVKNRVTLTHDHNWWDRLVSSYQAHAGPTGGLTVEYGVKMTMAGQLVPDPEDDFRLTDITYTDDRVVNYDYGAADGISDVLSRVYELDGDIGGSNTVFARYTYLGAGTIVKIAHPGVSGGLNLTYGAVGSNYPGFDRFGRIMDQLWENDSSTAKDHFEYGYDRASNRLWRLIGSSLKTGKDHVYDYDGLYRLEEYHYGTSAGSPPVIATGGNRTQGRGWELSLPSNWDGFNIDGNGDGDYIDAGTDLQQTRTHNEVNEIDNDDNDANTQTGGAITESPGNAWITPAYDRAGNMDLAPAPGNEHTATAGMLCVYDAWNRLRKVYQDANGDGDYDNPGDELIVEYRYDARHRRIVKLVREDQGEESDTWARTDYYYSKDWQVLDEYHDTGIAEANKNNVVTDLKYQYVWGIRYVDALVCRDEDADNDDDCTEAWPTDEHLYYTQDANFNVTSLVRSDTGRVAERYEYTPYGYVTVLDGDPGTVPSPGDADGTGVTEWNADSAGVSDWDNEVLFGGYRYDPETGLYHVRHRYYHPTLGRWVTRDPLDQDDPARHYQDGMNLYEYVSGSPTDMLDPEGTQPWSWSDPQTFCVARYVNWAWAKFRARINYSFARFRAWSDYSFGKFRAWSDYSFGRFRAWSDYSFGRFRARINYSFGRFRARINYSFARFGARINAGFERFYAMTGMRPFEMDGPIIPVCMPASGVTGGWRRASWAEFLDVISKYKINLRIYFRGEEVARVWSDGSG
ncbi:hypothetical protein LCGC14_0204520 [marine sediment metagenome]|uniref:Insecticide toxin TcdB middle/N-terminal domain-containing protein n=1 Tax=marine sediment metagenome TaxID=412755 RepID=A0A0F9UM35_9ZZZZ|nr:hypothetical protein [Phycisphaerae bacterium]